ncbi:uncharacterized protein [Haliotis asinina]|uniref:uncharacterized protein n=1 Tax=Haliotis asinina TaxID=109174 RepID=UPI00353203E4
MFHEGLLIGQKLVFFILSLTFVVRYASPDLITAYGAKWTNFTDVVIRTHIISEIGGVGSKFTCVTLCLENKACMSVFYRHQLRMCQLHDVLFMSPQDGDLEIGTLYFTVVTGGCPSTHAHNRILNMCYEVRFNRLNYADGVADCNSRGDHFIVIDSAEKQAHMLQQLTASSEAPVKKYLIDGSNIDGTWRFHDGRPMTFFDWLPNFPKNISGQNSLVADPEEAFLWGDKSGALPKRYICERDI